MEMVLALDQHLVVAKLDHSVLDPRSESDQASELHLHLALDQVSEQVYQAQQQDRQAV
jgi:hypothetical protein